MLIEIKDIYKIYNEGKESEVRALDGVSLTIDRGEFVAIIGAVRLRQVHADEHSGLSGHPHLWGLPSGRPGHHRAERPAAGPHPQQGDRLHLSGLQPDPRPHRL